MDTLLPFPLPAETENPAQAHELVARRAREIWLELGRPGGRDLDIWLEAEAEIQAIRERAFRYPHPPRNEE